MKAMSENFPISVIILTYNEVANIIKALDSVVGWAQEVFIVDSYSTDSTVDIVLSRTADGVKVVQHPFENYSKQWNWAIDSLPISTAWTLKLDADERVTPELRFEVERFIREARQDVEGVYFKPLFYFMDKPLRYGGISNNYHLRMWRTGKAAFENRPINEHALVEGKTVKLQSYVAHHDCKSLSDWIEKHNRYSSLEALALINGNVTGDIRPRLWGSPPERRMWLRSLSRYVPFRHLVYFLYRYAFRLGFLDGLPGFRYAFLHSCYRYWIDLKVLQYKRTGKLPTVKWPGRGQPHPLVQNSELQKYVDSLGH
jgi:glycosyltransferase involved in cell wall biosynthesis